MFGLRALPIFVALSLATVAAGQDTGNTVAWPEITAQCRPGGYWWWMGSAVNPGDLTREMERYKAAGMGGVHIIPIYGAKGYEDQYIDFLSPKWMEMLRHVVKEARRLDMFADMTTGTGWCFGGPDVSNADACALVEIKTTELKSGSRAPSPLAPLPAGEGRRFDRRALQALMAFGPDGRSVDLWDKIADDGSLDWTVPDGTWKLYRVGQRKWRGAVKRAAPGGAGPMLNPFADNSMPHYLERFTRAFAAYDGPRPRAMYHDSYEYGANWSPDVLAEFQRRRGYRLQDELPALAGNGPADHIARVKCDYRETLSDIMIDRFIPPWTDWSRREGFVTRYQAHGSPGNLLDLYALSDIPETEMFHTDRSTLVSKFASSAAHVAGRSLTAAETGTWLKEHFTETLADVKDLVDQMFLAGVNHIIYHGTCYSPDAAPWPGWVFYASTEMNPRNSIWYDVRTLNDYIARCQAVLQSGKPDNDLLVYWPVYDLWHDPSGMVKQFTVHDRYWIRGTPCAKISEGLWTRGYGFDYISDRQIAAANVADGKIVVPGGVYRAIVVPACEHIPVETMERLMALAKEGGTAVFAGRLPGDVPGARKLEERRAELKKLEAPIRVQGKWLASTQLGRGRILVGRLGEIFLQEGVEREILADQRGLQFIRRTRGQEHIYFVDNRGEKAIDDWLPLAVPAASVALLDPMTGRIGLAASRKSDGVQTEFYLQLPPGGSIIVQASPDRLSAPDWTYWRSTGQPIALTARWDVTFLHGGPQLPPEFKTDKLASWADQGGPAEAFAGTARYRTMFDRPPRAGRWLLDLGKVCQSARVSVNGQLLGTLIQAPYQIALPDLKPQGNLLEIEVTNLSANRIRDLDRRGVRWKTFRDANVLSVNYRPLDASRWPLTDSGLLGPVRLIPQKRLVP